MLPVPHLIRYQLLLLATKGHQLQLQVRDNQTSTSLLIITSETVDLFDGRDALHFAVPRVKPAVKRGEPRLAGICQETLRSDNCLYYFCIQASAPH
jgi:hypothetical protein